MEVHSTESEGNGQSEAPLASESSPAGKGRLWGVRSILPDKMLGVLASRKTSVGDPFLYLAPRVEQPRLDETAIAGNDGVESPIDSDGGPSLSRPAGLARNGNGPLPRSTADDNTPLSMQFDRQRDRLLAALASDQKQALPLIDGGDGKAARRRVEALMDQAREDLEQGRIASAYRTAQSAETIATEAGVVLDEGQQQPAELVRFLKERRVDDVGGATEIPPEQSVDSASGPALDLNDKLVIDPDLPAASETAVAGAIGSSPASGSPAAGPPAPQNDVSNKGSDLSSSAGVVEFLPPAPEPYPSEMRNRRTALEDAARRRTPSRTMALAEIVGPSTPMEGPAGAPQFEEVESNDSPEADIPQVAETGRRFLPEGFPSAGRRYSEDNENSHSLPPALEDGGTEASQQEHRNVDWADVPQPVIKVASTSLSRPVLAGIGVGAAWLVGFMLYRVFRATTVRRPTTKH